MLEFVRLGAISHSQSSCQTTHFVRPQGLNSCLYTHQRREDARSQCTRYAHLRARRLLCDGPGLHRLSTPIQASSKWCLLCDQSQKQPRCAPCLFSGCRQRRRSHLRSNHHAQWVLQGTRVSRASQKSQILRSTNQASIDLLNKQYLVASTDYSGFIQESVAGRIVLQVDQTTLEDQEVFGQLRERCQDSNLVRSVHLRAHSHYSQGA